VPSLPQSSRFRPLGYPVRPLLIPLVRNGREKKRVMLFPTVDFSGTRSGEVDFVFLENSAGVK